MSIISRRFLALAIGMIGLPFSGLTRNKKTEKKT